jgi:membrane protease subunit (stomatin/prohibitin family)
MGLFNFIKRQLLEVIEWEDSTKDTVVYKYPLTDRDEIMNSSTLIVRPSQVAVFVHKGQVADVFAPGTYKLSTENIPILTKILSLPTGGKVRIKADVYFVNTKQFNGLKWGTQNPVMMRDTDFGNVRIRAFGIYSFRVSDVKVFMEELFGTNPLYTLADMTDYIRPQIIQGVTDAVAESKISALDLAANYKEFSKDVVEYSQEEFAKLGLKLVSLVIENISLPEEVEKALDERTKIGVMEDKMGTYTQYQAANAMRDAAQNQGGGNLAGLGIGLGAGRGIGELFAENFNTKNKEEQVVCEKCGAKMKANAKFCPECGARKGAVCPKCGAALSKNAKFCPECGTSLKKTCKKCGADLKSTSKFCPECGAKVE